MSPTIHAHTLDPTRGYSQQPVPLAGHAVLAGTFAALMGTVVAAGRRRGVRLPARLGLADTASAGVATYKLARMVTKDRVTDFARAPFTELEGRQGRGEVSEHARDGNVRRAIGELVLCPYCISVWIAAGFAGGLVLAPRPTRLVVAVLNVVAVADALQMADRAAAARIER
jgi:hypothetical protein